MRSASIWDSALGKLPITFTSSPVVRTITKQPALSLIAIENMGFSSVRFIIQ
jgi:hypothetical protein